MPYFANFRSAIDYSINQLLRYGQPVDAGRWQGVPTEGRPDMITRELMNLTFEVPVNRGLPEESWVESPLVQLREDIQPNLPWADDHFVERVSRSPTNPGAQYMNWPWWRGQDDSTMENSKFSHSYQERFWPKEAGDLNNHKPHRGIRYAYGDLDDVVNLLLREPHTRQATFPIFFPEDTGAVHGGRVPCTLHYHFLRRGNLLHMWYPIRSCDAVRHFQDDLYMACRLMLWVLQELIDKDRNQWISVCPGTLYFTAYSFHIHEGDMHRVISS